MLDASICEGLRVCRCVRTIEGRERETVEREERVRVWTERGHGRGTDLECVCVVKFHQHPKMFLLVPIIEDHNYWSNTHTHAHVLNSPKG